MKQIMTFAAICVVLTGCDTGGAGRYLAPNGLVVEPAGDARFAVDYRGASGATAFWCAAGHYVVTSLGKSPTTAIWRVSEPPRRAGEGITFSLTSDGAASRTGIGTIFGKRGAALSAERARELCDPFNDL